MIRFKFVGVLLCLVFSEILGSELQDFHASDGGPAAEFSHHTLVTPRVYHGRHKRHIPTTTRDPSGGHVHDLVVELNDIDGRHWTLNLQLNRDLISKSYFEKHQLNGEYVVNTPSAQEVDMCHYKGTVRGIPDSWAAVSTCQGLSGVIFDGEELHYLEPRNSSTIDHSTPHYLYRHDHLQTNFTCGFPDTPEHLHENKPHHIHGSQEAHRILRYKRASSEGSEGVIRAPYNSNKMSRYVELVLVVDTREYKELGTLPEVYQHCKKITNIINALYMPLNIFVALVGVVVWTELDDIVLSPNGDTTLANFLHYRRGRLAKEHPNDNAQLLTRMQFDGGVVGKALKGPICTYEFSGGVSVDHSSVVGLVATTVAHEMGHNFGMEHDTSDCSCPSERCIMAPSSNSKHPTHWSSCSLEYLAHAFEHGMDYCLRNKPERLFESPVCGNGFVEPGEQCDCGLPEFCNNPCCNASTCMLFANASCATGECCDLQTCKPRKAGHMCRSADHECDLPEFCTGESEFCKDNVFKMDGEKCDKGKAFCYQGSCRTHSDQCRLLWGPSGASSDSQCYHMNTKGSQHGNCGYNRLNHSFIKCVNENILCGMLHCRHLNERLEYGMESVAILSQTFLNTGGNIIPCRTAIVDLGLNEVDPGLAPDGARCGEGKMCVNQKCLPVGALQKSACPNNCYGRGACNSKGNCHCDVGYAPPYCKDIGYGGSDDSGPASDPLADVSTAKVLIFLFALVFMSVILLLAVFYTRYWRLKKSPAAASAPAHSRSEKESGRTVEISGPLSPSDSAHASLLSSEPVLNGLLGHHKGFTISPLSPPAPTHGTAVPTRVAPARPTSPSGPSRPTSPSAIVRPTITSPTVTVRPTITSPTVTARPSITSPTTTVRPTVTSPTAPTGRPNSRSTSSGRPTISSPVLDATTSTAQQLISNAVPTTDQAGYTPVAISKPRPLSSPTTLNAIQPSVSATQPNVKFVTNVSNAPEPKVKFVGNASEAPVKSGPSALSRIASILKPNSKNSNPAKGKLDREALRNLKISEPIPQKEIEIPGNRPVVMRAHSLRDQGPVTPRPNIPNFGSMRGRRPVSIPTARPTSPPPPRPPPPKATAEYDDCLNVQSTAPLANIDEEMPSPTDNIYAVIEECPPVPKTRPVQQQQQQQQEVPVSAGSCESVGLLSEIVNEMQARNIESIYTSSLGRKKKKKQEEEEKLKEAASRFPDRASSISTSSSSVGTYVNAPYTQPSASYNRPGGMYTNVSPTPSQAGYLRPNPVAPPIPSTLPVAAVPSNSFSTFKGKANDRQLAAAPTPAPYKPFSSTLQRASGPLTGLRVAPKPGDKKPEEKAVSAAPKPVEKAVSSITPSSSVPNSSAPTSATPSSSVVKSVLAAVENSKKSDLTNKPSSLTDTDPEKKVGKGISSMANRPLPEKPSNTSSLKSAQEKSQKSTPLADKSQKGRSKPGAPVTAVKPSSVTSPDKPTPSFIRNKSAPQVPTQNKVPPTPPPAHNKPSTNKSSPDVVSSCGTERGNREPDVVSPATSPLNAKSAADTKRGPPPSRAAPSHVASLQQKFEAGSKASENGRAKSKVAPPVTARSDVRKK